VWGRSPVSECCQVPSVSDEDLQAQAWFPGTLTVMLHLAEQAATRTLNDSSECIVTLTLKTLNPKPTTLNDSSEFNVTACNTALTRKQVGSGVRVQSLQYSIRGHCLGAVAGLVRSSLLPEYSPRSSCSSHGVQQLQRVLKKAKPPACLPDADSKYCRSIQLLHTAVLCDQHVTTSPRTVPAV